MYSWARCLKSLCLRFLDYKIGLVSLLIASLEVKKKRQQNLVFELQHYISWTSPNGQHQNQTDCILCSQRWRSSIQLAKTRLGADCGSDHELLIAKFRLKLKKVGKITRPLRYAESNPLWLYSGSKKHK